MTQCPDIFPKYPCIICRAAWFHIMEQWKNIEIRLDLSEQLAKHIRENHNDHATPHG